MRVLFLIVFLIVLIIEGHSQDTNKISIGIRFFQESDGPFIYKRKHPDKDYIYNYGTGLRGKYLRKLNGRISIGGETGVWFFFNNNKKLDFKMQEYKTRSIMTPLMGVLCFNTQAKNSNYIIFSLKGGATFIDNMQRYNNNSVTRNLKLTGIFEISISLQIVWKNHGAVQPGYGCEFIEKKFIRSVYADFKEFKF